MLTVTKNIVTSISQTHKHGFPGSGNHHPPEALSRCYTDVARLAASCLLAIKAHFTYSSTPLVFICVALDILYAGSDSALLFYQVRSTDGLHGPGREDLVFQVFSIGSWGDQGRILGGAKPMAAFSWTD